jgi:hypothetical protein
MPSKRKPLQPLSTTKAKQTRRNQPRLEDLYPSLRQAPKPADRLADLRHQAAARQIPSMTEEEYRRHLEAFRDLWGSEEEIDAFVRWVHQARREGR